MDALDGRWGEERGVEEGEMAVQREKAGFYPSNNRAVDLPLLLEVKRGLGGAVVKS